MIQLSETYTYEGAKNWDTGKRRAAPQTQTFDDSTYLTDKAFYNSLISGGVQWEPLEKD